MKRAIMNKYGNDIGWLLSDALKKGAWAAVFLAAVLILAGGGLTL